MLTGFYQKNKVFEKSLWKGIKIFLNNKETKQNLSEEEYKKCQYSRERYRNVPEDERQRPV